MNNKAKISILLAIGAVSILAHNYTPGGGMDNKPQTFIQHQHDKCSVFDFSECAYLPMMGEPDYISTKLTMQENGLDYTNYFVQSGIAITRMRRFDDYEYAQKVIDCEMETFKRNGYFPRPPYKKFQQGWVSSMDAPLVALASQMIYEKTGDEKYKDFVNQLSDYILKDVKEHGFVTMASGKKWLFEYADVNTTEDNGEFVFNGSLLGTLATYMVADATQNKELMTLVDEQIENYKAHADKYLYQDGKWCYYMLNPKRVNPPRYILFEIRLLDALYDVSKDAFFEEQANLRRNILLDYYPGFKDNNTLSFLRGGAPHYYFIDIYDTQLQFYNKNGELLAQKVYSGREEANNIFNMDIPEGTNHVDWTAHTNFYDVYIGTINIIESNKSISDCQVDGQFRASGDGVLNGNILTIIPNSGKTNLTYNFNNTEQLHYHDIYVLELENNSSAAYSMNVVLYDSKGNAIDRYLPKLHQGKCSIPFSLPGFIEGKEPLSDIKNFNLRIYAKDGAPAEIKTGKVYKFSNIGEYITYLKQTDYTPAWGE